MSHYTQQESSLGFESVILNGKRRGDPWGPWRKLEDDETLAQLHAKWWCKSIVDEEEEWRRKQKFGVASGHEFGHGCYALDIGIEELEIKKIWIRADYIRIYDYCNEHYQRAVQLDKRAPSVVITGQPGIGKGKSVWIYYALRRRLSEGQPVMWYRDSRLFLFVGKGVFETPKEFPPSYLTPFIWTLVDSDGSRSGVPEYLITHGTRHFVIFVSCPNRERWSKMGDTMTLAIAIMNPWTEEEMLQAASLCGDLDHTDVKQMYYWLGPTPRICIDLLRNPPDMKHHLYLFARGITELTLDRLREMTCQSKGLAMDAVSETIILITRREEFELATVAPITGYVKSELLRKLALEERERGLDLFSTLELVPPGGLVAGLIYESLSHKVLGANINLELVPMVKLNEPSEGKKLPQSYSGCQFICLFFFFLVEPTATGGTRG